MAGTEMMDSQLMGEFEADAKELEADSWSFIVDKKLLKQLKKEVIKRQDVIYGKSQTRSSQEASAFTFKLCEKYWNCWSHVIKFLLPPLIIRAHPDRNAPREDLEDYGWCLQ